MREDAALQTAIDRLAEFVGEEEAAAKFSHCLTALEIGQVETPEDLLRVSECLMGLGSVATLIGRALKARALEMSRR